MNLREALEYTRTHAGMVVSCRVPSGDQCFFSYRFGRGFLFRGGLVSSGAIPLREDATTPILMGIWEHVLHPRATFLVYETSLSGLTHAEAKDTPERLYSLFGCNAPHVTRLVAAMREEYGFKPKDPQEKKPKEKKKNVRNGKRVTKKRARRR